MILKNILAFLIGLGGTFVLVFGLIYSLKFDHLGYFIVEALVGMAMLAFSFDNFSHKNTKNDDNV